MILKGEKADYQINDDILNNVPNIVYVKEIPSLRVQFTKGNLNEPYGVLYNVFVPHFYDEFKNHDGNIVSVNAFPPFPKSANHLDLVLSYIKNNIKDTNTKFFFENVHEGNVVGCLKGIYEIINILNLNTNNVYFFAGVMQAKEMHDEFCEVKGITNKIHVKIYNAWERHIALHTDKTFIPKYEVTNKDKKFLCFNRIMRPHRLALLSLLNEKRLIDCSFYSFFTKGYGDPLYVLNYSLSDNLYKRIEQGYNQLLPSLPLKVNSDSAELNINYVKTDDYHFYENSYFSIVTETFFFKHPNNDFVFNTEYDELAVFFSEKVFKPIICKHPFIMLNRPHALKHLRDIGYKTFNPYINESYDSIEDDELRLLFIVDEIERLCKQTPNDWLIWQKNVSSIVEHNYNVITNKIYKDHIIDY